MPSIDSFGSWPIGSNVGVCTYCGRIGRMTRDHKEPKRYRKYLPSSEVVILPCCGFCNQRKGDMTFEDFRERLLTERGYLSLINMWSTVVRMRPAVQCDPMQGIHRCAAYKPCNILRRNVLVLGDGLSVFDYYLNGTMVQGAFDYAAKPSAMRKSPSASMFTGATPKNQSANTIAATT